MKKLITLFSLFIIASTAFAQTDSVDYYLPSKPDSSAKSKISASLSMGTGFSVYNRPIRNTSYSTFIVPKIGYQFTPKFNLNFGVVHYTVSGNGIMALNQQEAFFNPNKNTVSGNLLFAEGEYQLNKRLILSGAMMFDADRFNINKRNDYKAGSFSVEYKITEHSSIQFQTSVSSGKGNYYSNPYPFSVNGFNTFGTSSWNGVEHILGR